MNRSIQMLYFAAIRDTVGKSEEELALPAAVATVADLATFLEARYPPLAGRLGTVRFAVNEAFAESDTALTSGDVVGVIPPVAGG